ncbi:MAG: hypothetical protein SRB1_00934 [Desulfobacteraceae bacterium Eth-SRB1]|nr:MAG: hypothetical protein SRB1_00934 [Desulfobacteraceae bacterium Eth-SRB1]
MRKLVAYLLMGRRLLKMTMLCCRDMLTFFSHKNFDSFSTYRERILSLSTMATLQSGVVYGCVIKYHAAPPSVISIFKEQ